LIDSRPTRYR